VSAPLPDGNQALADLRELFALANVSPELAKCVVKALEKSPPFRIADIDWMPAVGTKDGVVLYQLSEELHGLLTAARIGARHRDAEEINRNELAAHDAIPSDSEITPEMIKAGVKEFSICEPWDSRQSVVTAIYLAMKNVEPPLPRSS
jgi:hypothetical protein